MGSPFVPIYSNDFSGAFPLSSLAGNGSAAESGGKLAVSASLGQNCQWAQGTSGRQVVLPYAPIATRRDFNKIYLEFTVSSWTTSDTAHTRILAVLHQDDNNLFTIFSDDGVLFQAQKVAGVTWTTLAGSVSTTLPRKFRFVWDLLLSTVSFQCQTTTSPVTWTDIAAPQPNAFGLARLGLTLANTFFSGNYPSAAVQYDDLLIYADSYQQLALDPAGLEDKEAIIPAGGPVDYISNAGRGRRTSDPSGLEDRGIVVPAGGPTDFGSGTERGRRTGDDAALEERLVFPKAGGQPDPMSGISQGRLVPDHAGTEDSHHVETAVPAYVDGQLDDQGRNLVGDLFVYDLQLYDTAGESWANPVGGNGFHGAGRNGRFHWDGYETGPLLNGTSFGTLAGGFNSRTWMTDREPSAIHSDVANIAMYLVSDDHVRFATAAPMSSGEAKGLYSRMRWQLPGDFDIQVGFENRSAAGVNCAAPAFTARVDDRSRISIQRIGSFYSTQVFAGNILVFSANAASSDAYGQLRLTRTGRTVSSFYWNSGWVALCPGISRSVFREEMDAEVEVGGVSGTIASLDVFGFTIASGTADNTAGWFREPAGQWRGSRQDFPERALVCASRFAVDIIDQENSRLWMRFAARDGYAMHHASIPCRRARMRDGMLMVPYNFGGDICADFTTDDIRFHAGSGSTLVGAVLDGYNGSHPSPPGASGRDVGPVGLVANRNAGDGYSLAYDNWQVPGRNVYDADLFENDGYLYKVHATDAGIGAHKWRRWWFDGATPSNWWSPGVGRSAETTSMLWCRIASGGDLYYMDSSDIHSADFANWDAHVNGSLQTWTADHSAALPGTRSYDSQYRAVFIGSDVFVPANEGLYRSAWPGPFLLAYGWDASGALHNILGWAPRSVVSVEAVLDSLGTPLLALGTQFLHDGNMWSQIVLVNPATDAIYGLAPAARGRRSQAMVVVV
jgi:hypothetical protein